MFTDTLPLQRIPRLFLYTNTEEKNEKKNKEIFWTGLGTTVFFLCPWQVYSLKQKHRWSSPLNADLPSWQSQSCLTSGSTFSPSADTCQGGCRSWQDSWALGLLCPTAAGNPQHCGGVVPVRPLGSPACLAQLPQCTGTSEALQPSSSFGARPAGDSCHCPCVPGSLGRGLQPQQRSCATTACNCNPSRTRWLLGAAPVSICRIPAQAAQEMLEKGGFHSSLGKKLRDPDAQMCEVAVLAGSSTPWLLSLPPWVTWLIGRHLSRYSPGQVNYKPWYQAPN